MKDGVKILVAYDGSVHGDNALSEAIDQAKKFSGSITVLHVRYRESEDVSKSLLKKTEDRLRKNNVKYDLRSELGEDSPRVITRIADDEGYGLITMGSRGIGGARAWLMGSVSTAVASRARCPVLVVK